MLMLGWSYHSAINIFDKIRQFAFSSQILRLLLLIILKLNKDADAFVL